MNQQKLKIIFKENLLNIKIDKKLKVKDLFTHLRRTLNISEENKLILFNRNEKIDENEEFSDINKYKEKLVLIEDRDYSKIKNKNDKKDKSLKNISSNSQSNMNTKSRIPEEVNNSEFPSLADLIMECTEGKEKIISNPIKKNRRRNNPYGHENPLLNMLYGEMDFEIVSDNDEDDEDDDYDLEDGYFEEMEDEDFSSEEDFIQNEVGILMPTNQNQTHPAFIIHRGEISGVGSVNSGQGNNLMRAMMRFVNADHINQEIHSHNYNNVPNNHNVPNNNNVIQPNRIRDLIYYDPNFLNILVDMGFSEHNSRIALRMTRNDLEMSTHYLLNAPDMFFIENEQMAVDNIQIVDDNNINTNINTNINNINNVSNLEDEFQVFWDVNEINSINEGNINNIENNQFINNNNSDQSLNSNIPNLPNQSYNNRQQSNPTFRIPTARNNINLQPNLNIVQAENESINSESNQIPMDGKIKINNYLDFVRMMAMQGFHIEFGVLESEQSQQITESEKEYNEEDEDQQDNN